MVKRYRTNGFSLVELMIALALGTVVTTGVVQLFVANSETHKLLIGQSRMQESARFALDFIGRKVRQAGYRGCFSGNEDLWTTIGDPDNNIPYEFDLRFGIEGYEGSGGSTWNPALTDLPNIADASSVFETGYGYGGGGGIDLDAIQSGTDVVTLRHLSQVDARIGGYKDAANVTQYGPMPSSTEPIVVGVPIGWSEFDLDHIVLIHDCEKATIFRVTTSNPWGRNADDSPKPAAVADDLTIGHDMDDVDTTQNSNLDLALINTFGVDASVSAIESHTFFIAPGEGKNNVGETPLSLWRKSTLDPPIELVEGVENLQLLYGVDTDNDGVPNQYLRASLVTDWQKVITVRVEIWVNSVDSVGSRSNDDGLIRRHFTQTIQLRNHG